MIKEALRRILLAPLLCVGGVVVALAGVPVILLGRASYMEAVASALSRSLNAATGGDQHLTFSAQSALNEERGKALAAFRRRCVDAVNLTPGHCAWALAEARAGDYWPEAIR
jgi:hypothetical protein